MTMFGWTGHRRLIYADSRSRPKGTVPGRTHIGGQKMLAILLAVMMNTAVAAPPASAVEELRAMTPRSAPFEEYLSRTGEQPPDFDALPSQARVSSVLAASPGGPAAEITTPQAWSVERTRVLDLLKHWFMGSVPPPPKNVAAKVLEEKDEVNCVYRDVELHFGPDAKAVLHLQTYTPKGAGPFPVFITQDNHRGWALIALRRGYIACVYAGADQRDDTDSFTAAYPKYDWSRLCRRGWAAGRCIDYLTTLPEVNARQIAIAGHSRNGKTSLMAAALDERIAAVISSSSGTGGTIPSRACGSQDLAEDIESITRSFPEWFHPRWRFFSGREQKLPVDMPQLVAMSAPRPCLLSTACNDGVEHGWAMQQTYLAVQPLYRLLGAEGNLRILWRPGSHETGPDTIERYMDWCDSKFGRGVHEFPEELPFPWNWDAWRANNKAAPNVETLPETSWEQHSAAVTVPNPARRDTVRAAVQSMLGPEPPGAVAQNDDYGIESDGLKHALHRYEAGTGLEMDDTMFGEYINANIYMPKGAKEGKAKLPGVLWLPADSIPGGYTVPYKRGDYAYRNVARAGCAVFCYDPIGTGRRIAEIRDFYDRHPDWSVMGKMLRDARAALDAMRQLPYIDPDNITVFGYAQGAFVAAHLAALDDRPARFVLVAPPLPFRLDTDVNETGGILRWSKDTLLLPALGLFAGKETRVPYDLDDLLVAAAPRPLLLVHPGHDRFAPVAPFKAFTDRMAALYKAAGKPENLVILEPDTYNQFNEDVQKEVIAAMKKTFGK